MGNRHSKLSEINKKINLLEIDMKKNHEMLINYNYTIKNLLKNNKKKILF